MNLTHSVSKRNKLSIEEKDKLVTHTRNIGIVAHIDAGKTTTTERMLFYAGVVKRIGEVDQGNTTTDFMKEEVERGITIQSAAVSLTWNKCTINLIDTPGHVDFTVEVERAMRVVDGVVALFDSSAGVQAQSYTVLQQSRKFNIPVIAFLNKMDKYNANYEKSVQSIREKLRVEPLLVQYPLYSLNGQFDGVVDIPSLTLYRFTGEHGERVIVHDMMKRFQTPQHDKDSTTREDDNTNKNNNTLRQNETCSPGKPENYGNHTNSTSAIESANVAITQTIPASESTTCVADNVTDRDVEFIREAVLQARHNLICQLTQYDDTLAEELITNLDMTNGDDHAAELELSAHSIHVAIRRLMLHSRNDQPQVVPILCGASRRDQGVQPLLDAIVHYLPSPRDRTVQGLTREGEVATLPQASCTTQMPTYALAFKVSHCNDWSGKRRPLVFLRVYTGRLTPRMTIYNNSRNTTEVIDKLYVMHANSPMEVNELCAGAIGAAFLKSSFTGDTLFAPYEPSYYSPQHWSSTRRKDLTTTNNSANYNSISSNHNYSYGDGNHTAAYPYTVSQMPVEVQMKLQQKYNMTVPYGDNVKIPTTPFATSADQERQHVGNINAKSKNTMKSNMTNHYCEQQHHQQPYVSEESANGEAKSVFTLEGIIAPVAVLSFSIEAATKNDVTALDEALSELSREDPSLRVSKDNFGNVVVSGMGELHLEIILSRLHHEYHIDCRMLRAIIEYRETTRTLYKLESIVGLHLECPYVECSLELHPLVNEYGICATAANCSFVIDDTLMEKLRNGEGVYELFNSNKSQDVNLEQTNSITDNNNSNSDNNRSSSKKK